MSYSNDGTSAQEVHLHGTLGRQVPSDDDAEDASRRVVRVTALGELEHSYGSEAKTIMVSQRQLSSGQQITWGSRTCLIINSVVKTADHIKYEVL